MAGSADVSLRRLLLSAERFSPELSYLVPVRNAEKLIVDQLEAIVEDRARLPVRAEIIVIDDASTDSTAVVAERWFADNEIQDATVLRRGLHGGPNASRNAGLRQAKGGFVIFVDGDDILVPGAGSALWNRRQPWSMLGGRVDVAGLPATRADSEWTLPRWCGWRFGHGGLMAGDLTMFVDCGGFDENILLGGTETEFAIRAQSQFGVSVIPVPEAKLLYRTPTSASGRFRKNFQRERGYAYTQRKHRSVIVDDGWRIGFSQVLRGLGSLGRTRSIPNQTGVPLLAAGVGRLLGRLVWRTAGLFTPRRSRISDLGAGES